MKLKLCLVCNKVYEDHSHIERQIHTAQYIEQRQKQNPSGCPADCNHTNEEHDRQAQRSADSGE